MRVTTIRRVKRVGRKWETVSAKQYIVWRPEEILLAKRIVVESRERGRK